MTASRADAESGAPSAPLRYAGRRRSVMVVDDDAAHRALMRDILEPLGITVAEAPDGPACLALLEAGAPDLVLLDIAMPGMSGWTVAGRLRDRAPSVRIAMMSANVHEISPATGADAPHDAIIAKPFDLRDFLDRVTRLLDLAWVEAAQPEPAGPTAAPVEALPPRPVLQELARLGRIGHVRAIEARLAEIAGGEAGAFAARLRRLVAAFDLPAYMRALDSALAEPAGEPPPDADRMSVREPADV